MEVGTTVFQWQRSNRCKTLKIRATDGYRNNSYPTVKIAIKNWDGHPNNIVKETVTLPYTIDSVNADYYYVISVKLASSSSIATDYIYADCL